MIQICHSFKLLLNHYMMLNFVYKHFFQGKIAHVMYLEN